MPSMFRFLGKSPHFVFPERQPQEAYVGTSFQFRLDTSNYESLQEYQKLVINKISFQMSNSAIIEETYWKEEKSWPGLAAWM